MSRNQNRSLSPVTRVYAELQGMLTSNEFDRIVPLINSAVNSNDTTTHFRRPQNVFEEDSMDTDPPAAAAVASASSLNPHRLDAIDTDAAIARQLQEDEYSRESLAPHLQSNRRRNPTSTTSKSTSRPALSDAEYAAQLQAEEERNQRRNNPRRFVPSLNPPRTSNRSNQSDTITTDVATNASQHRSSSNRASNNNNTDVASFSQFLSMFQQNFAPRHSNGVHDLENSSEDFGPDDYENLLELDRSLPNTRLTENEINRLPIERFRPRTANKEEDNKCNICWDEFKLNETLRRLPCLHAYHQTCIDPWLKTNNTCPVCRVATRLN